MTLPVFLTPAAGSALAGGSITLDGEEARHAVVVRRIRAGERIVLADGAGTSATCVVESTTKSSLVATVESTEHEERPTPQVTVVQAIPKGERADLAVSVLTEIGTDRIVPWAASRCVAVWRGERAGKSLARWRATARESAKQARRSWLPEVTEMADTAAVAGLLADADVAVVLHEDAHAALADLPIGTASSVVVVVGPEGGISPEELEAFSGARQVRLGSPVLRTSTAGVAAVAAVLSRTPRWSSSG